MLVVTDKGLVEHGVAVFGKVQSVLAIGMMTLLALLGIWGLTGFGLEN
ncbi:hypothetical protein [Aneurinibacillus aneurinilyticus]|nr:hypothetical protein [Aneurinibacillus aneurinilyticus]